MKPVTLRWLRTFAALVASLSLLAAGTVRANRCGGAEPMPCCKGPGLSNPMACCATQAREARPAIAAVVADQKPIPLDHVERVPAHLGEAAAQVPVSSLFAFVPRGAPSTVLRI